MEIQNGAYMIASRFCKYHLAVVVGRIMRLTPGQHGPPHNRGCGASVQIGREVNLKVSSVRYGNSSGDCGKPGLSYIKCIEFFPAKTPLSRYLGEFGQLRGFPSFSLGLLSPVISTNLCAGFRKAAG